MAVFPDPDAPDLLKQLGVVVPDDASALDDDLRLLEEERLGRHPSGRPADADDPAPGRSGFVAFLAVAVLVAVGMLSAAVTFLAPRVPTTTPSSLPLATAGAATAAAAPQPRALLPEGTVRREGRSLPARDLRPAALVVAPDPDCTGCAAALAEVAQTGREFAIPVAYVVPAEQEGPGSAVARRAAGRAADVVTDVDGVLGTTDGAAAAEPRLVLVHADGVVGYAGPVEDVGRLHQRLAPLSDPGAPPETAAAGTPGSPSGGTAPSVR